MACYWGCATNRSKGAWLAFVLLLIAGAACAVAGAVVVAQCVRSVPCRRDAAGPELAICYQERRNCARPGAIALAVAGIFLMAAAMPLLFFCCCAIDPEIFNKQRPRRYQHHHHQPGGGGGGGGGGAPYAAATYGAGPLAAPLPL
jgi:hypothetical protein